MKSVSRSLNSVRLDLDGWNKIKRRRKWRFSHIISNEVIGVSLQKLWDGNVTSIKLPSFRISGWKQEFDAFILLIFDTEFLQSSLQDMMSMVIALLNDI